MFRYIGVDRPGTKHPTQGVEPYGREASGRNRQLAEGKPLYMKKHVSETDKYGRLLRHVQVGDTMVSAVLVQEGYAQVATYLLTPQCEFLRRLRSSVSFWPR